MCVTNDPDDRVPYALAFYAGLRREEIHRLRWEDVGLDGFRLWVRKSKSAAGTNRRPPISEPLRAVLREAALRNPSEPDDRVSAVSVMSSKLAERATEAWTAAGLERITLHEGRHTYASFLMAAGYTLKELMEFVGHSDLQMVQRYTKLLPQPEEHDPAERLNAYLRRRQGHADSGAEWALVGHAVGHKCQPRAVRGGRTAGFRIRAKPLPERGKRPTLPMPEEGLEPPTRGL
jgi:integrase